MVGWEELIVTSAKHKIESCPSCFCFCLNAFMGICRAKAYSVKYAFILGVVRGDRSMARVASGVSQKIYGGKDGWVGGQIYNLQRDV